MKTETKEIKGFEGLYSISAAGTIISLKSNKVRRTCRVKGYIKVILTKRGKQTCFQVHRLMAIHFIPNPLNKPQVNHINGVKDDNRIENLEWVTHSENNKHAYALGLISQKGSKNAYSKLNETIVSEIRQRYVPYKVTIQQLADEYGMKYGTVKAAIQGITWAI